jgi:UPF0716 protein FxsA
LAVLLVLLFLVPVIELYVIVQVGQAIGALSTLALLIAFSVVGLWLVKHEGVGVWTRFRRQLRDGGLPANEAIDGVLILFAGLFMLVPGFITDFIGLFLIVPPTRSIVRMFVRHWFERRLRFATVAFDAVGNTGYAAFTIGGRGPEIVDTQSRPLDERRPQPPDRPELGQV